MVNHESRPLGKRTRNRDSYRGLTHENSFKTLMKLQTNTTGRNHAAECAIHPSNDHNDNPYCEEVLAYVQAFNFQNGKNLIMKLRRPTECEHHDNKNTVAHNTAKITA
jgi:hypothetical protein